MHLVACKSVIMSLRYAGLKFGIFCAWFFKFSRDQCVYRPNKMSVFASNKNYTFFIFLNTTIPASILDVYKPTDATPAPAAT